MPWPLPPSPVDIRVLAFLAGTWQGEGTAIYPTISKTKYFDELVYELDEAAGFISYKQRTWYNINGEKGNTLHFESGFIKISDKGCEMVNAQGNGRTEVMEALFVSGGIYKRLYFMSRFFSNDPRMVSSRRDITVQGNSLKYEMKMATQNTKELQTHLVSTLKKIS